MNAKRRIGLAAGIALMGGALAGCAADAGQGENTARTSQATAVPVVPINYAQGQADVTAIFDALLSGDVSNLPTGGPNNSCNTMRDEIQLLVGYGFTVANLGKTTVIYDDLPATEYAFVSWTAPSGVTSTLKTQAALCYGGDPISDFLVFVGDLWFMDPTPVQLNESLAASPAGASATGTDNQGTAVTVYEWPATCQENTVAAGALPFQGGEVSSPVALASGTLTSRHIVIGSQAGCPAGWAKSL